MNQSMRIMGGSVTTGKCASGHDWISNATNSRVKQWLLSYFQAQPGQLAADGNMYHMVVS